MAVLHADSNISISKIQVKWSVLQIWSHTYVNACLAQCVYYLRICTQIAVDKWLTTKPDITVLQVNRKKMRKLRIEFGHKMVEKKELLEVCSLVRGRVYISSTINFNWLAKQYVCVFIIIFSII